MALLSFSHLGVCVSDLERSTRFYTEVLGFRELFTIEMGSEVASTMEVDGRFESRMLARGDVRIELLHWLDRRPDGDGSRRPMTGLGLTHLCFRVDAIDDLFAAAERCGGYAHRATLSVMDGAGVGGVAVKTVYLTDPDGTRIECIAGSPDLAAF